MSKDKVLRDILGSDTTDKTVHAQAILEVLKTAANDEEKAELLAIALTERDSVPKHPKTLANKGIPEDVWDELVKSHIDVVKGNLKVAFTKSRTAKEFAKHILKLMDLFDDENEKTFVLSRSLYSEYTPFRELPGTPMKMPEHKFAHIIKSNEDQAKLIQYIAGIPFGQLTEEVSLVLQILDKQNEQEVRVALFALYLGLYQKRMADTIRKAIE